MFRSVAPPAPGPSSPRGPSGTVIPGTAPVPDFQRSQSRTPPRGNAPAHLRRLNKCMFLEYDEREQRWRDALNRTGRVAAPVALKPRREQEREVRKPSSLPPLPMAPPVWENPVVVGLLLAVCPPVGVTLAWSARSIPHSGRVALTMFGAFVMLTATLVACMLLI